LATIVRLLILPLIKWIQDQISGQRVSFSK